MVPFDHMHQLMNDDVFRTTARLLCKFRVKPDATSIDTAGAPLSAHSLDTQFGGLYANTFLPLRQLQDGQCLQLLPVPSLQYPIAGSRVRPGANVDVQHLLAAKYHLAGTGLLNQPHPVSMPEEIVALAGHHLPTRFAALALEPRAFPLDPG